MISRDYTSWYEQILVYEGGRVDNPSDPGGPTQFGVSSRGKDPATVKKIQTGTLTKGEAIEIYRRHHIELMKAAPSITSLPDGLHFALLDAKIQGPMALRIVSEAIRAALHAFNRSVDPRGEVNDELVRLILGLKGSELTSLLRALKKEKSSIASVLALRIARVNSKQKSIGPKPLLAGMVSRMNFRFAKLV